MIWELNISNNMSTSSSAKTFFCTALVTHFVCPLSAIVARRNGGEYACTQGHMTGTKQCWLRTNQVKLVNMCLHDSQDQKRWGQN